MNYIDGDDDRDDDNDIQPNFECDDDDDNTFRLNFKYTRFNILIFKHASQSTLTTILLTH